MSHTIDDVWTQLEKHDEIVVSIPRERMDAFRKSLDRKKGRIQKSLEGTGTEIFIKKKIVAEENGIVRLKIILSNSRRETILDIEVPEKMPRDADDLAEIAAELEDLGE